MRLIDADELYVDARLGENEEPHISLRQINDAPTVEPVRHGHWINDKGIYKCTACNNLCTIAGWSSSVSEEQMYKVFKFCPDCGAKMDEVEDDNNN